MQDREKIIVRTSIIGILTNLLLVALKLFVGIIALSVSIIMDAVNNLSDALSSTITIIGTKISQKKPDAKHPYGHGRVEYVTSFIISALILAAGVMAIYESVMTIINKNEPTFEIWSVILISIAVLVKIGLGIYFRYMGKKVNSQALKGSGIDALFDALLSLGTLVSIIVYLIWGVVIEGYIGIVIGLFMLKSGIDIFRESLSSIIGERIDSEEAEEIKKFVCSFPEVKGAYDLIVNNYGYKRGIGSIHIEVDDNLTAKEIHPLTRRITTEAYQKFGIIMTVGIYSSNTSDEEILKMRNAVQKEVLSYDNIKQIHAFYLDNEKKVISFDVVVDFKEKDSATLINQIKENLGKTYPDYSFIIVEDKDFSD